MSPKPTSHTGEKDVSDKASDAAEDAANSRGFQLAARAGYVAAGILHFVIGLIALGLATGEPGSADQSGAIRQLASYPYGILLLWFCLIGCLALALFEFSEVFFGVRHLSGKDKLLARVKHGGKAVVYAVIGVTFGQFAMGGGSRSSSSSTMSSLSAILMGNPAGAALLLAVGVGVLGVAGYFAYSGATGHFRKKLTALPAGGAGQGIVALGTLGYIAKGFALGVVGLLVIISTITNDPEESTGLDGALHALRDQPFGPWLLGAVAIGLMAYGVFMVVRSRYQRM